MDTPKVSWWWRLCYWWNHRHKKDCDQCGGHFRERDLGPTSGDWWICPACWDKLHKEMEAQRASSPTRRST